MRITFLTQDGMLVSISAYTGSTDLDNGGNIDHSIYVDINGPKGPNQFGKDFFSFKRTKKGIMPTGYEYSAASVNYNCSKSSSGTYCAAKLFKDGWKMNADYPW